MTQEEFEDLKSRIFRDIESIRSNCRCQALPRRSATITTESQRVGILSTTTQQASNSTQAAASSSYVYYTPSPLGFGNPPSVLTVQDEGSRHNLSGILSQLPDLTSTQIIEQPQQQQPQLQLFSCKLFQFSSQNITVQYKYLSQKNTYTTPNMKQITHGTTHNKKGHIEKKLK